jgi:carbonic anhydrase
MTHRMPARDRPGAETAESNEVATLRRNTSFADQNTTGIAGMFQGDRAVARDFPTVTCGYQTEVVMESGSDCCTTCHPDDNGRRVWLKGGMSACAIALLAGIGCGPEVAEAALTQAQRDALTPDQIIEIMKKGNERFRSGKMKPQDFLAQKRASASGQYPAAIILSCIDSRAPAEIILDIGIGDTFNARVAGNVANPDMLGSMEFACAVAGAKVILVMGHTACGAIKGAIDNVQLGNLTGLLESIKPAIEVTQYEGEHTSKNAGFVDAVAQSNVRHTIDVIRGNSSILADLEKKGQVRIVGAMYDLHNGKVSFMS